MRRFLMYLGAFAFIFLLQKQRTYAQPESNSLNNKTDSSLIFYERGFAFYTVLPHLALRQTGNINSIINEYDYPSIPTLATQWGFGTQYRWNRFALFIEAVGSRQTKTNTMESTEILLQNFTTNIGLKYNLLRYKNIVVSPLLAYSATNTDLTLTKQSNMPNFNSAINTAGNSVRVDHVKEGFAFGVSVDFQQLWNETSLLYSLTSAYSYTPDGATAWTSAYTNFTNPPESSFNTFFIQLSLGFTLNWNK